MLQMYILLSNNLVSFLCSMLLYLLLCSFIHFLVVVTSCAHLQKTCSYVSEKMAHPLMQMHLAIICWSSLPAISQWIHQAFAEPHMPLKKPCDCHFPAALDVLLSPRLASALLHSFLGPVSFSDAGLTVTMKMSLKEIFRKQAGMAKGDVVCPVSWC